MNALRKYRKKANLSQSRLANMLGITQSSVSQWENGLTFPRWQILKKTSDILCCKVEDLLE